MTSPLHSHILRIPVGADVAKSVFDFAHRRGKGICILGGDGAVTNVTLRQPNGKILTFEGNFEIVSMSGTFLPSSASYLTPGNGERMTVCLSGTRGKVVGGTVMPPLVASRLVTLMVVSFEDHALVDDHQEEHGLNAAKPVEEGGGGLSNAQGSTSEIRNMMNIHHHLLKS